MVRMPGPDRTVSHVAVIFFVSWMNRSSAISCSVRGPKSEWPPSLGESAIAVNLPVPDESGFAEPRAGGDDRAVAAFHRRAGVELHDLIRLKQLDPLGVRDQIIYKHDPIHPKIVRQLHLIELPTEIGERYLSPGDGPGDPDASLVNPLHRRLRGAGEEIFHDLQEARASGILGDGFVDLLKLGIKDRQPRVRTADVACEKHASNPIKPTERDDNEEHEGRREGK